MVLRRRLRRRCRCGAVRSVSIRRVGWTRRVRRWRVGPRVARWRSVGRMRLRRSRRRSWCRRRVRRRREPVGGVGVLHPAGHWSGAGGDDLLVGDARGDPVGGVCAAARVGLSGSGCRGWLVLAVATAWRSAGPASSTPAPGRGASHPAPGGPFASMPHLSRVWGVGFSSAFVKGLEVIQPMQILVLGPEGLGRSALEETLTRLGYVVMAAEARPDRARARLGGHRDVRPAG